MAEGPTLTTVRLLALPITVWSAGFVAEELAPVIGSTVARAEGDDSGADEPAARLRRDLRRRCVAGPQVLTWVVRDGASNALGVLTADARGRRVVVSASVGRPYRRRGVATEAVRALASWLEDRGRMVVEARIRPGDLPAERLAAATCFVPTDLLVHNTWRIWYRPPVR